MWLFNKIIIKIKTIKIIKKNRIKI